MLQYKKCSVANQCLLFVHIPKTAGTSFRTAGLQYFGQGHTLLDYGDLSPVTSKEVKDIIYSYNDLYRFQKLINDKSFHFLSGHYIVSKYAKLFPFYNIVSFVREPTQQVVSHYYHYQRHYNYKKDLISFCEEKRFQNLQSQYLSNTLLEFIGFIGITEEYQQSIRYINDFYKLDLPIVETNRNKTKKTTLYSIDDEARQIILSRNKEDVTLYNKALSIFKERVKLYRENKPFIYGCANLLNNKLLKGWASSVFDEQVVKVNIFLNGEIISTLLAKEYNLSAKDNNSIRNGLIGFSFDFPRVLTVNDHIVCRVDGTQQELLIYR